MGKSRIDRSEVLHVAQLARLEFEEAALDSMQQELDAILNYVAELDALDVEGVSPLVHAGPACAPLRPDEPVPSLSTEEALASAPEVEDSAFAVPRVLGGDG